MFTEFLSFSLNQTISQNSVSNGFGGVSGWFIVRILVSRASIPFETLKTQKINFSKETYIGKDTHKMYLESYQVKYLSSMPKEFELRKLTQKVPKMFSKTMKYKELGADQTIKQFIIRSTKEWRPFSRNIKFNELYSGVYSVFCTNSDMYKMKNDQRIDSISEPFNLTLKNRYNSGFLQTGDYFGKYVGSDREIERKLTDIGLDGRGQIINVVDSGLDIFHPFFFDPNESVEYFRGKSLKFNLNHRKVVSYLMTDDSSDYIGGHGTHCAGTVAGKADCENCGINKYRGVAPEAKIFMVDLCKGQSTAFSSNYEIVNITGEMGTQFDCRIVSNSWSSEEAVPQLSEAYNIAASAFPNTLFVFAAGNKGENFSIGAPSDSKNVLTVGALNPTYPMFAQIPTFALINITGENVSVNAKLVGGTGSVNVAETKEDPLDWLNVSIADEESNKTDGIVLANIENYYNITEKNDEVCQKAKELEKQGARAMILKAEVDVGAFCNTSFLPIFYVAEDDFSKLQKVESVSLNFTNNENAFNEPSIAYFSSRGPGWNCITKPDVTAPGFMTLSANASDEPPEVMRPLNYSSLKFLSGTSMATPAISGVIALIRQFFLDGWYQTLSENKNETVLPSAALMRATLIASARSPLGNEKPTSIYGYGTPNLMNVFPFNNTETQGFRFIDNVVPSPMSQETYKIEITNDEHPLSIVMSYTDDTNANEISQTLIIDLDLVVVSPSGALYYGNMGLNSNSTDMFNTNEKVFIEKPEIGEYTIRVISNNFDRDYFSATYSIAVSGGFPHKDEEKNPFKLQKKVLGTCTKCEGKCVNGFCVCPDDRADIDCATEVVTLLENKVYEADLYHASPLFAKIDFGVYDPHDPPTLIVNVPKIDGFYSLVVSKEHFSKINERDLQTVLLSDSVFTSKIKGEVGKPMTVYCAFYASLIDKGKIRFTFSTNGGKIPIVTVTPTPVPEKDVQEVVKQKSSTAILFLCLSCISLTISACGVVAFVLITKYENDELLDNNLGLNL